MNDSTMVPTELRSIQGLMEYRACVELQRATWGEAFREIVPASVMMVAAKVGGVTAGAFDGGGRLQGFVFGLAGYRDDGPVHWSHMLAVRESVQGQGLGRRLKLYQREQVLGQGVRDVYWTFDPLFARNAHLNLNRLGATVVDYQVNLYGDDTRSRLRTRSGTDRLIVHWALESDRTVRALHGESVADAGAYRNAPVLSPRDQEVEERIGDVPRLLIEIPWDVQALKRTDGDEVARWRRTTRRAFSHCLERGYRVEGLLRDLEAKRCFYQARRR